MTFPGVTIREAVPSELPQLLTFLKHCNLPVEGVAEHFGGFLVARDKRSLLGVVGLECYGEVALLRSLAVSPQARGKALGAALVQAVIDRAREKSIRTLYLLTETAESFFPRFGFEKISRTELHPRLAASFELQGACPDTAVAMRLAVRVSL